jgi:hypothetical protein
VKDTSFVYRGKRYLTERITIRSNDGILKFSASVRLRHPRKAKLLSALVRQVQRDKSVVHIYQRVASWCGTPRTWRDIAKHFRLTQSETQSVLGTLRKKRLIKTIHPPVQLAKFIVK